VITLSSVAGSVWGHMPMGAGLRIASTYFIQAIKKRVFQQKFGPNILKNAYFFEESCKITAASGSPPPKIPAVFRWLGTSPSDPCVVTLTYWYKLVEV